MSHPGVGSTEEGVSSNKQRHTAGHLVLSETEKIIYMAIYAMQQ